MLSLDRNKYQGEYVGEFSTELSLDVVNEVFLYLTLSQCSCTVKFTLTAIPHMKELNPLSFILDSSTNLV